MLQVFSDAGVWNDIGFATTLILENWNTQLAFFSRKYEGLQSCTVSEIMGIDQGLQWILENRPEEKALEVYADNISVAQILCNYVENHNASWKAYPGLWMHVTNLCDQFNHISVSHIPAHQQEHNPNKACDMLCSALLRPYKWDARRRLCTQ